MSNCLYVILVFLVIVLARLVLKPLVRKAKRLLMKGPKVLENK